MSSQINALAMVRLIRKTDARVPIVMVSKQPCAKEAGMSGATRFLLREQSSRIGETVVEILSAVLAPVEAKGQM